MVSDSVDWLVLGCYAACVYLLVRPSSKAKDAIDGYFTGMATLARIATDF
jgi:hypothetical protein